MINLLSSYWKFWDKPNNFEKSQSFANETTFVVKLKAVTIGYLHFSSGKWKFEYDQKLTQPVITDFPSTSQVYESEDLWPFFASRIPGIKHPYVKEKLKKMNISSEVKPTEVDMLRWFGARTIANPYELVVQKSVSPSPSSKN